MPLRRSFLTLLFALTLISPSLLAGGWRLNTLPLLVALATASWITKIVSSYRSGRHVQVPLISGGLIALSAFCIFQCVSIGPVLDLLSPQAAALRAFVLPEGPQTISYEVGATYREAAKLMTYAMVAAIAHELTRRRGLRQVLVPVVLAVLLSILTAVTHRFLRIDVLWGVFDGLTPAGSLATTFQNPNHASAFCTIGALTAAGLGVGANSRAEQLVYVLLGAIFVGATVADPSKGGLIALAIGFVIFAIRLRLTAITTSSYGLRALIGALVLPLFIIALRLNAVIREFGLGTEAKTLGLSEKFAAFSGAFHMVTDHPLVGVGRGAYVSIYSKYQVSPLQLIFAFPENIFAQLVSEWGVIVGCLALGGLIWSVSHRMVHAHRPEELGASAALAALVVHDLFDFSLEMPGIAVPTAALAGALTSTRKPHKSNSRRTDSKVNSGFKLYLRSYSRLAFTVVAPSVLILVLTQMAFLNGDINSDLHWLRSYGEDLVNGETFDETLVDSRYSRHPANVWITSHVSYLYEIKNPRNLSEALRYTNKALYLGPRYADAHLSAARLLHHAGHRQQALGELRRAWILTKGREDVSIAIERISLRADDIRYALPRTDPTWDIVSVPDLIRMATQLISRHKPDKARALLQTVTPGDVPSDYADNFVHAATQSGTPELGIKIGLSHLKSEPHNHLLKLAVARAMLADGQTDDAERYLRNIPSNTAGIPIREVLELRIDLSVTRGKYHEAQATLDELQRHLPLTRKNQATIAERKARLHLREKRPDRAVIELGHALEWSPLNANLRLLRAQALNALGRRPEAIVDVEFVLRRNRKHHVAKRLLRELRSSD